VESGVGSCDAKRFGPSRGRSARLPSWGGEGLHRHVRRGWGRAQVPRLRCCRRSCRGGLLGRGWRGRWPSAGGSSLPRRAAFGSRRSSVWGEGRPAELAELRAPFARPSASRADACVLRRGNLSRTQVDDGDRSDGGGRRSSDEQGDGVRSLRWPLRGARREPYRGADRAPARHAKARPRLIGSVASATSDRGRGAISGVERARDDAVCGLRRSGARDLRRWSQRWRRRGWIRADADRWRRRSHTRPQPLPTFLAEDELIGVVASARAADHRA
jgi:hypothetical protein